MVADANRGMGHGLNTERTRIVFRIPAAFHPWPPPNTRAIPVSCGSVLRIRPGLQPHCRLKPELQLDSDVCQSCQRWGKVAEKLPRRKLLTTIELRRAERCVPRAAKPWGGTDLGSLHNARGRGASTKRVPTRSVGTRSETRLTASVPARAAADRCLRQRQRRRVAACGPLGGPLVVVRSVIAVAGERLSLIGIVLVVAGHFLPHQPRAGRLAMHFGAEDMVARDVGLGLHGQHQPEAGAIAGIESKTTWPGVI